MAVEGEGFFKRAIKDKLFRKKPESKTKTEKKGEKKPKVELEVVKTPEMLTNIRFQEVFDKKGNFVGYKSSEVGRKEAVLRVPQGTLTDLNRAYTVSVVGDTKPGQNKGSFIVELAEPLETTDQKPKQLFSTNFSGAPGTGKTMYLKELQRSPNRVLLREALEEAVRVPVPSNLTPSEAEEKTKRRMVINSLRDRLNRVQGDLNDSSMRSQIAKQTGESIADVTIKLLGSESNLQRELQNALTVLPADEKSNELARVRANLQQLTAVRNAEQNRKNLTKSYEANSFYERQIKNADLELLALEPLPEEKAAIKKTSAEQIVGKKKEESFTTEELKELRDLDALKVEAVKANTARASIDENLPSEQRARLFLTFNKERIEREKKYVDAFKGLRARLKEATIDNLYAELIQGEKDFEKLKKDEQPGSTKRVEAINKMAEIGSLLREVGETDVTEFERYRRITDLEKDPTLKDEVRSGLIARYRGEAGNRNAEPENAITAKYVGESYEKGTKRIIGEFLKRTENLSTNPFSKAFNTSSPEAVPEQKESKELEKLQKIREEAFQALSAQLSLGTNVGIKEYSKLYKEQNDKIENTRSLYREAFGALPDDLKQREIEKIYPEFLKADKFYGIGMSDPKILPTESSKRYAQRELFTSFLVDAGETVIGDKARKQKISELKEKIEKNNERIQKATSPDVVVVLEAENARNRRLFDRYQGSAQASESAPSAQTNAAEQKTPDEYLAMRDIKASALEKLQRVPEDIDNLSSRDASRIYNEVYGGLTELEKKYQQNLAKLPENFKQREIDNLYAELIKAEQKAGEERKKGSVTEQTRQIVSFYGGLLRQAGEEEAFIDGNSRRVATFEVIQDATRTSDPKEKARLERVVARLKGELGDSAEAARAKYYLFDTTASMGSMGPQEKRQENASLMQVASFRTSIVNKLTESARLYINGSVRDSFKVDEEVAQETKKLAALINALPEREKENQRRQLIKEQSMASERFRSELTKDLSSLETKKFARLSDNAARILREIGETNDRPEARATKITSLGKEIDDLKIKRSQLRLGDPEVQEINKRINEAQTEISRYKGEPLGAQNIAPPSETQESPELKKVIELKEALNAKRREYSVGNSQLTFDKLSEIAKQKKTLEDQVVTALRALPEREQEIQLRKLYQEIIDAEKFYSEARKNPGTSESQQGARAVDDAARLLIRFGRTAAYDFDRKPEVARLNKRISELSNQRKGLQPENSLLAKIDSEIAKAKREISILNGEPIDENSANSAPAVKEDPATVRVRNLIASIIVKQGELYNTEQNKQDPKRGDKIDNLYSKILGDRDSLVTLINSLPEDEIEEQVRLLFREIGVIQERLYEVRVRNGYGSPEETQGARLSDRLADILRGVGEEQFLYRAERNSEIKRLEDKVTKLTEERQKLGLTPADNKRTLDIDTEIATIKKTISKYKGEPLNPQETIQGSSNSDLQEVIQAFDAFEERIENELVDDVDETTDENFEDNEGGELKHKEALKDRVAHLRRSVPFQVLAQMIRDPELRQEYELMMARRSEMIATQRGGERHRMLTPMIVSLMMGKRTKPLFDMVIDKTVDERSLEIKQTLSENPNLYAREVVIGSGPHAAIWNVNRQMVIPEDPAVTLERDRRIGGQFGQIGIDLFALNSRTREFLRDTRSLPGTPQTLNTFTDMATTNPADTGIESYQKQSALGDHARLNLFLSGESVTNAEVYGIRTNYTGESTHTIEFVDTKTGRLMEMATDRVVLTTGVGEERTGLNESSRSTMEIVQEEKVKLARGEDAQVMSFEEAARRLGNPEDPFPLKDFKRIIISGEGDGSKVLAGVFLGYEGQIGLSTQMDRIESITWLGQSIPTKEKFIEECRARYHHLGLEFPRKAAEGYYHRISPVPNARASTLKRSGGEIEVTTVSGDAFRKSIQTYKGDHFIYAHGFEDKTSKLLERVSREDVYDTPNRVKKFIEETGDDSLEETVKRKPISIFFKNPEETGIKRLDLSPLQSDELEYTQISADGELSKITIPSRELYPLLAKTLPKARISEGITSVEVYSGDVPEGNVYGDNGSPIGKKYQYTEVYKAGPASGLEITDEEREAAPILETIPENTAALFRYADYTAELARQLANEDKEVDQNGVEKPEGLFNALTQRTQEEKELKKGSRAVRTDFEITGSRETPVGIPFAMSPRDMLRFGIGTALYDADLPGDVDTITLKISRLSAKQGSSPEEPKYSIESSEPLSGALRQALEEGFLGYTTVALERLMGEQKGSRKPKGVTITLPLKTETRPNARPEIDIAEVNYSVR